jgi:uncharacterized protein YbcI
MSMSSDTDDAPAGSDGAEHREGVLSRVSSEMVQAMRRHYGKGPVSAKSYLVDDLLFVVMRGGMTRAERTMLDAGREDSVRGFRQEFESEMAEPLIRMIERVTGRHVVNYHSQVLFDPDMTIEIFVFDEQQPTAVHFDDTKPMRES